MDYKRFVSLCDDLAKKLLDEGKLVEAGWYVYRQKVVPKDASAEQLEALRATFIAGAQHVFYSITGALGDGQEPTAQDLMRMDNLDNELDKLSRELSMSHVKNTSQH